jgi:hypothetical protein
MDADGKLRCETSLAALADLRARGQLPDDLWSKGVVCVACEYMEGDEPDLAAAALQSVPISYYEDGTQLRHLDEDPKYLDLCRRLVTQLAIRGFLGSEGVPEPKARA